MTRFTSFGFLLAAALAAGAQPRIAPDGVRNSASYAPAGFLDSGIAQGSLFVVQGDNLGPDVLQVAGLPLPRSLAGVSVTVTSPTGAHDAYLYYVSAHAIAGLLPSGTPLGPATVTVTYQGQTSKTADIVVAQRKIGLFTLNQAGSGPAVAQNYNSTTDQPVNTLVTPARPGQVVTLWATGLGPVSGDEAATPQVGNLDPIGYLSVGGKPALIRYAGRSGCCVGVDQIIFEVPAGVEGCYVPVIAVTGSFAVNNLIRQVPMDGPSSNFATISVASQGVCSDPTGLTGDELHRLQTAGTSNLGILEFDGNAQGLGSDALAARFSRADLLSFLQSRGVFGLPVPGSCIAYPTGPDPAQFTPLDAGPNLTVAGPGGSRHLARRANGSYATVAPFAELLTPGAYSIDNGSGGTDIGGFRSTFNVPPAVQWLNPKLSGSNVSPLIQWSGGDPNGYVLITSVAQNNAAQSTTLCVEANAAGSFQVPSYAYAINGADGVFGPSPNTVSVGSAGAPVRFTAPGLDLGFIFATLFAPGTYIP